MRVWANETIRTGGQDLAFQGRRPRQFPLRPYTLGDLVPAGAQDLRSFTGHSQEQGAFFSAGRQPRGRCAGLPEATEGRTKGEPEQPGGPLEGRERHRIDRTRRIRREAEATRPEGAHGKPPWGQNASLVRRNRRSRR